MASSLRSNGHKKREMPLETYLREINEVALLSADEAVALAAEIAVGNIQSFKTLTRANLRLVVNVARGYCGKGLDLSDLIEEGNIGLMRAATDFSPVEFGTRFSTYATWWIKQSIKRALQEKAKTVRAPGWILTLQAQWERTRQELKKKKKKDPTNEQIADAIGLPRRRIKRVLQYMECAGHGMQGQALEGEGSFTLNEIPDRDGDPAVLVEAQELRERAMALLPGLDEREQVIIRRRFGIDDYEPMTLKEIGDTLGLTRERVRQIEAVAIGKLSKWIGAENGEGETAPAISSTTQPL